MTLKWSEMPQLYKQQRLWGACTKRFTFVVSDDVEEGIHASVKVHSHWTTPFDGTRHDLGMFDTIEEAKKACERFKPS